MGATGLVIQLAYVISAALFIFGLKLLGSAATARKGNLLSAVGMLLAIVAALLDQGIVEYQWILLGFVLGGVIGAGAARLVQMTSMPEMVALFNGFGGMASLLVGAAALATASGTFVLVTIVLSILIGGLTFTGSLVAYGKLSETIGSGAVTFRGQQIVNSLIVLGILASAVMFCLQPENSQWLYLIVGSVTAVRYHGCDPDWRRRHAGGDLPAQLLLRSCGLCGRFRD
jgi:H+-translocating NAD(P) transhydrogenase subunit beta